MVNKVLQTVLANSGQKWANFCRNAKLSDEKLIKDRCSCMTSTRLKMVELADRFPVMASNQSQIALKGHICSNILGSEILSGIKVSFKSIVSEFLWDNILISRIKVACV